MADLTVKAYAELIHTPLHGQLRILREHKYPKQTDGQFRIPYYQPAIRHIRRYYETGNNQIHLPGGVAELRGAGKDLTKINHNLRVIQCFRNGSQSARQCTLQRQATSSITLGPVNLRATPDIMLVEGVNAVAKFILFDCREPHLRPEEEIIRTTVELFHHTLTANGSQVPVRNIEYICLDGDVVYKWSSVRKKTLERAITTADGINAVWNSIQQRGG